MTNEKIEVITEQRVIEQVTAALNDDCDPSNHNFIQSQLRERREQALLEPMGFDVLAWLQVNWLRAVSVSAPVALALVIWVSPGMQIEHGSDVGLIAITDNIGDDIEFYDEIAFYEWLPEES